MAPSPLAEMEGMVKHLTHWGNEQIHDPFFAGIQVWNNNLISVWLKYSNALIIFYLRREKSGRSEWNELHVKYGSSFEPVVWDNINPVSLPRTDASKTICLWMTEHTIFFFFFAFQRALSWFQISELGLVEFINELF